RPVSTWSKPASCSAPPRQRTSCTARSRTWRICCRSVWKTRFTSRKSSSKPSRRRSASAVRSAARWRNASTKGTCVVNDSLNRMMAMTARYYYLLRSSWLRLAELIFWPAMQMLVWGFLYTYLYNSNSSMANTGGMLLGAVLLWDVLFRGQLGFSFTFLEEIWSRNLANLMMSPLQPAELAASLMAMSLVRLLIGTLPVTLLAFVLFGFNI